MRLALVLVRRALLAPAAAQAADVPTARTLYQDGPEGRYLMEGPWLFRPDAADRAFHRVVDRTVGCSGQTSAMHLDNFTTQVWTFTGGPMPIDDFLTLQTLPSSVRRHRDFFHAHGLRHVFFVASDFQQDSMNVYFGLEDHCRNEAWIRKLVEETGGGPEDPAVYSAMLASLAVSAGIARMSSSCCLVCSTLACGRSILLITGMISRFCFIARCTLATVCASTPCAASMMSNAPSHALKLRETS